MKIKEQRRALENVFSIDVRSLALLRIGFGLILIVDLMIRVTDLVAHYTDAGVLPRHVVITDFSNPWAFSIHFLSGQAAFQLLLFALAGVAAFALLLGYRTKWATFISWFFLVSLHTRNPEIINSGDVLLRLLLFWSLFLPLNLKWSVDRTFASNEQDLPKRVFSFGTAAIMAQAAFVYIFTWLLKTDFVWQDGQAITMALNIDQYTTPLANIALQFPRLLALTSLGVYWFELLGPLLLFVPFKIGPLRTFLVFLFWLMHLGFGLFLTLGLFPWVSTLSLVPFLPTWFWDKLKRMTYQGSGKLIVFYDGGCTFCYKITLLLQTFLILGPIQIRQAQDDADVEKVMRDESSWIVRDAEGCLHTKARALKVLLRASPVFWLLHYVLLIKPIRVLLDRLYGWIVNNRPIASHALRGLQIQSIEWRLKRPYQAIAGVLLLYVLVWNIDSLSAQARPLRQIAYTLRLEQRWAMFAPYPSTSSGWYVVRGVAAGGHEVNLLNELVLKTNESTFTWNKPGEIALMYPNQRWRKYSENLRIKRNGNLPRYFAGYLCNLWNNQRGFGEYVKQVEIYFMRENTRHRIAGVELPAQKMELGRYVCASESIENYAEVLYP